MRDALRDFTKEVLDVNEANNATKRSMINYSLHFLHFLTTRESDFEHHMIGTEVFRWLSAADLALNHETAQKLCHEDTG